MPLRRFSDYLDADISMMTVHSAKGLEWDSVFIPGVTRFDWPGRICSRCESAGMCSRSARGCRIVDAKKMPDGLIEEKGLLYVGCHSRPQSGIYLRFYAAQVKLRELSDCLPLLPNVSSGNRTRELDGHGRGGVICGSTERACFWREVWSRLSLWSHGVCPGCSLTRTAWALVSW